MLIHADEQSFDAEITSDEVTLVDFWASWCMPCRMLGPVLDKISQKHRVVKVDVTTSPALAQRFGISSIPAILIFKSGRLVSQTVGFKNENELAAMLQAAGAA